ncbi:thermonuclease family protein [Enterococcus hulanensis]|uniref:Thermonuclease family protein n=1 Tax=Enterococcus hulanensis TaxID=2559929 RepID=A0ABU3F1V7_9ENTE|nr:thermonuclease family protein [Enterococcus hulanensis]MDT2601118.1 thermonuclease family protein [Enterococcus hulanensis]MDT2610400.1 thermonuclease family protein [Enterococcus hulanensis]MDT2617127.1 thermonuclease family protein [Enterococcus hulanensis]MDT2628353.1 thermonuclease family protein [Enterococcus hulanensis]MDT2655458.1 thermonuclease family protein [Enterococcus hulanensis]
MKKRIGVKLGVTFAVLVSFLFASPTQHYQVEAAKSKTEKTVKINRTANKKVIVTVKKYVDGDTTRFKLKNGKTVTAKYLLIKAPELKKENPYAQEAKDRTKEILKNAEKIQIEYDKDAKRDSKKRELVYVWADGKLVQETLADEGLAVARSTKGKNTKYLDKIKKAEEKAKEQSRNIWAIENYAQAGKGYNQTAADEYKKAQAEAKAAKKAEEERLKKEQEAKEAEEKRAAEQAEAARKAEEKRLAEEAEAAKKAEEERIAQEAAAQQAAAAQAQAEAEAQAQQQAQAAEAAQGQTVYVTPTGSKYHTHKCGNGTYTPATLEEAQNRGLTACAKCY